MSLIRDTEIPAVHQRSASSIELLLKRALDWSSGVNLIDHVEFGPHQTALVEVRFTFPKSDSATMPVKYWVQWQVAKPIVPCSRRVKHGSSVTVDSMGSGSSSTCTTTFHRHGKHKSDHSSKVWTSKRLSQNYPNSTKPWSHWIWSGYDRGRSDSFRRVRVGEVACHTQGIQ